MEIEKRKEATHTADPAKRYELSALIDADSFFYTYHSSEEIIKSDHLSIEDFFQSTWRNDLPGGFDKANVGVVNSYFTIIPAADYETHDLSSLINNAVGNVLIHDQIYRSDFLPGLNAYLCYALSSSVLGQLREFIPNFALCHVVTALISNIAKNGDRSLVHLCRLGRQTVMIVRNEQKLLLATLLNAEQPMSLLYFSTLAVNSYQLDLKKVDVQFSGDFEPESEIAVLFNSYFGQVSFRNIDISVAGQGEQTTSKYFPIRSVALCA